MSAIVVRDGHRAAGRRDAPAESFGSSSAPAGTPRALRRPAATSPAGAPRHDLADPEAGGVQLDDGPGQEVDGAAGRPPASRPGRRRRGRAGRSRRREGRRRGVARAARAARVDVPGVADDTAAGSPGTGGAPSASAAGRAAPRRRGPSPIFSPPYSAMRPALSGGRPRACAPRAAPGRARREGSAGPRPPPARVAPAISTPRPRRPWTATRAVQRQAGGVLVEAGDGDAGPRGRWPRPRRPSATQSVPRMRVTAAPSVRLRTMDSSTGRTPGRSVTMSTVCERRLQAGREERMRCLRRRPPRRATRSAPRRRGARR